MKHRKICFLFNTRNCYQIFEKIFFKKSICDFKDCLFLNVDIFSDPQQKVLGETICKQHNIVNLPTENVQNIASVAKTLEMAFDYIEQNNLDVDWIMWVTQDMYFPQNDFIDKLESFVSRDVIEEKVGLVGFANMDIPGIGECAYGSSCILKDSVGEPFRTWYLNLPENYINSEYFVVETPCDSALLVNRKLYRKYIKSDYNILLYMYSPDIAFQFMLNNIASVTMPNLIAMDDRRFKEMFGVLMAERQNSYYHYEVKNNNLKYWKNKWGFWYAGYDGHSVNVEENIRKKIEENINMYKGTLVEKLYKLSIYDGPKTLKDLDLE